MSTKLLRLIRSLCMLAALSGAAYLSIGATLELPAAAASRARSLSVLGGKLPFVLKGYETRPMPSDQSSTMYFNSQSNQAIIVTEGPVPVATGETSDNAFRVAVDTLKEKQNAASANYRITSEKTIAVNGLKVYRLDGTDDVNGMQLLMATLMAIDNQKIAVIEVMSSVNDAAGHTAAVNNILSGKTSESK